MSKHMKTDRRVIYTKRAIRDSFVELIKQKPIEKISVTEICKLADINRGTFYSHYSDPYALRKSLEDELIEAMTERKESLGVKTLDLEQSLVLIKSQKELCKIFAGPYANKSALLEIMSRHVRRFLGTREQYMSNVSERDFDFISNMVISSITITMKEWFDNDLEDDPQHVAMLLNKFIFKGLDSFLSKE